MHYYLKDYIRNVDGITDNTKEIQDVLDECSSNGGGTVVFESGKIYRSGSLVIHSNTELHFEINSILKASDDMRKFNLFNQEIDYDEELQVPSFVKCDYNGKPVLYFLYAKDATNIKITGFGAIDGNEEIYYGKTSKYQIDGKFYPRMPLIYFEHCTDLSFIDITLQRSAFWTLHLIGCEDVIIDRIRIDNNLRLTNCDGIDPDHCKNVLISNCRIRCADDGIVFKNTEAYKQYGSLENITVTNCNIMTTSGAFKFGTESVSDFKNITISNCVIHSSNRGITFQLRDEGNIENVTFSNITIDTRMFNKENWWGSSEPIAITAIRRFENTKVGHIRNITFRDIYANSESGILIFGEDYKENEKTIKNIRFYNVNINLRGVTKYPKDIHDLRPYYKVSMIKDTLAFVYSNNATELIFKDCTYNCDDKLKQFMKNEFVFENTSLIK